MTGRAESIVLLEQLAAPNPDAAMLRLCGLAAAAHSLAGAVCSTCSPEDRGLFGLCEAIFEQADALLVPVADLVKQAKAARERQA